MLVKFFNTCLVGALLVTAPKIVTAENIRPAVPFEAVVGKTFQIGAFKYTPARCYSDGSVLVNVTVVGSDQHMAYFNLKPGELTPAAEIQLAEIVFPRRHNLPGTLFLKLISTDSYGSLCRLLITFSQFALPET